MTPADRIIGKFGSVRGLARALGHRNPTTVQGWRERGSIPIQHAPAIIAASTELVEQVTAEDFVPNASDEASSDPLTTDIPLTLHHSDTTVLQAGTSGSPSR